MGKIFYKTNIPSGSGIQPPPPRHDIGRTLKHEILRKRSSYPLKEYMRQRLDSLAKAAGFGSYFEYEYHKKK